jgi:predicted TIM-barrel fold metal-dependent hydrolase|tara:strand:- start:22 stop:840 length:819 start_codon:yes stop_codon:yes gene_type:complete
MDANGIENSWLLTWEIPSDHDDPSYHTVLNPTHMRRNGTHSGIPLSDLIKARDRNPERFILGYCPDPRLETAEKLFQAAVEMFNVRVCGEWKFRLNIDDPCCIRLFKKAGELRCPVVLHLDVPWLSNSKGEMEFQKNWYGGTIHNLESVLKFCPEVNFIGHGPGFWREISGDAEKSSHMYPSGLIKKEGVIHRLFRENENFYADLSAGSGLNAINRDRGHAKKFLEKFSDRLLFGRDYYGSKLIEAINALELSDSTKQKILSVNALRLLAIE